MELCLTIPDGPSKGRAGGKSAVSVYPPKSNDCGNIYLPPSDAVKENETNTAEQSLFDFFFNLNN